MSGVTGYVFHFDGDPSGACEPGATTTATAALSQTFGCDQWFLHVCALDAAGNLSPVATGGPWEVVNDFFCDCFESGDTLCWSSVVP